MTLFIFDIIHFQKCLKNMPGFVLFLELLLKTHLTRNYKVVKLHRKHGNNFV